MLRGKNCHVAIIKKIDMRVEIGMRDCLRNNDIYYGGVKINNTESKFSNFVSIDTQVHSNVASLTLPFHELSL